MIVCCDQYSHEVGPAAIQSFKPSQMATNCLQNRSTLKYQTLYSLLVVIGHGALPPLTTLQYITRLPRLVHRFTHRPDSFSCSSGGVCVLCYKLGTHGHGMLGKARHALTCFAFQEFQRPFPLKDFDDRRVRVRGAVDHVNTLARSFDRLTDFSGLAQSYNKRPSALLDIADG